MGMTDNYHFENMTNLYLHRTFSHVLLILVLRLRETDIKAGLGEAAEELERNGQSCLIYQHHGYQDLTLRKVENEY
jgi:hypothetical protein